MKNAYSETDWVKTNLNLPILYLAGENDPVIMTKEDWRRAQLFLIRLGIHMSKEKMYHHMRHEILHEVRKDVVSKILEFLLKKRTA